ncbi:MAG TPA: hypothetical protein VMB71_12520, partial [Acetobacteraceae bacterium]|nr:hypothetical protein [Acetobacteraceae bacterium]
AGNWAEGTGRRTEASRGAAVAKRVWMYVGGRAGNKPPPGEKAAITAAARQQVPVLHALSLG